jgi:hypothetical protein
MFGAGALLERATQAGDKQAERLRLGVAHLGETAYMALGLHIQMAQVGGRILVKDVSSRD